MKRILNKTQEKCRATAVIMVLFIAATIAALVASMFHLSWTQWRHSDRSEYVAEALLVAQSELDCMFCEWGNAMVLRNPATTPITEVLDNPGGWDTVSGDNGWKSVHRTVDDLENNTPSWRTPYLSAHSSRWRVLRSMEIVQFGEKNGTPVYEMNGTVGGTDFGKVRFFVARVTVTGGSPAGSGWNTGIRGGPPIYVQMGRRFCNGNLSPFTNLGSYTGKMEISPGETTMIKGTISANGDVYIGGVGLVEIYGKVRFGNKLNENPTGDPNFTPPANPPEGSEPYVPYDGDKDGNTVGNPYYDNYFGPGEKTDPEWNPGGAYDDDTQARVDKAERLTRPKEITGLNPEALAKKYPSLFPTVNDARRLVVAPPVGTDPPEVAPYRMYNRAGVRITVAQDGNVSAVRVASDGSTTPIATADFISESETREMVYDKREGRPFAITTIDMAAFTNYVNTNAGMSGFNGVLYVHDETTTDGAIRIKNGQSVPGGDSAAADGTGFTFVTNNPLYVQGDYNTTPGTTGDVSRAAIICDAITLLSKNWDDANATPDGSLDDRVAKNPGASNEFVTTMNAGVLTGNAPTDVVAGNFSGGLQNLVRYLENWENNTFIYKGSLGQIFESAFQKVGLKTGQTGVVYTPPVRVLEFDSELANRPPNGSLETPIFTSGDLFLFTRYSDT